MPISSLFVAKLLLFFFFFFSTAFIHQSNSLKFEYKSFPDKDDADFKFDGSQGDSRIYKGALQVTRDTNNPSYGLTSSSGRIVYKKDFRLWKNGKNGTAEVASFNTTFVINIFLNTGSMGGEGLAFILASNWTLPENSHGRWMGIVNEANDGEESNGIIAIEFDTRNSSSDDVDGNHVGVDVNGIRSRIQVPLAGYGVNLTNGTDVTASIVYDGISKNMSIFVAMGNSTTPATDGSNPVINSWPLDLSKFLKEDVYIGFSGSTGDQSNITQLNCVKAWSFSGTDITGKKNKLMLILYIAIGVLLVAVIACALVFFTCWRKRKTDRIKSRQKSIQVSMLDGSPRKFKLKELKSATCNFHPRNKLGEGGFGTVYKGVLNDTKQKVAVKRVSKDSKQGEQEFINEITTIGKLNHKNLVKLIGWCYKSENDFLLVYEFMPNGSLDKLLFSHENPAGVYSDQLSWDKRHNIIKGVAHALCYLHNGCAKRVFHRDVKSSNVMLDANFDARLGDFGLARAVQQDGKTHHTTSNISGTPGYVAPEYFLTARANGETDVYGFGVFIMEVACGRRPYNIQSHGHGPHGAKIGSNNEIVKWLWDLHGRGRIVRAVDPTLGGVFDQTQVECVLRLGLACCHPNPKERPTMRLATQVLIGEASTPEVPIEQPAFMWPVVNMSIEESPEEFSTIDLDEPTNEI